MDSGAVRKGDGADGSDDVRAVLLACALWLTGCGAAQSIAECTLKDRQHLADPLTGVILQDVKHGQREPSQVLRSEVETLLREYSVHLVRCALRELISEWSRQPRDPRSGHAISLARQLESDL